MTPSDRTLLFLALGGVVLLVGLVTRLKVNPFVALLLAALSVGVPAAVLGVPRAGVAGPPVPYSLAGALGSLTDGFGATLGGIAAILGLGAILGILLAESGGAEVLAERLATAFGPSRAQWVAGLLGLLVGLATWFAVGFLLLLPILVSLTRRTGQPYLRLALPLLAGLSAMHGLMPPHPGPVVAVEALGADMGWVLVWGLAVGIPSALVAGPLLARWIVPRLQVEVSAAGAAPIMDAGGAGPDTRRPPGFGLTLFTILLPLALLTLSTLAPVAWDADTPGRRVVAFLGHPTMALLLSVLFASWALGTRCGFRPADLLRATEKGVAGVGMTLLVVGAGGAFARVLRDTGCADAIGRMAEALHLPPLLYGWAMAVFIRVATGSATVAIVTASALLAPLVASHPEYTPHQVALVVCALGAGSLFLSHLNDGGFWIVKDGLGLSVDQTLRSWSLSETVLSLVGLALAWGYFQWAGAG